MFHHSLNAVWKEKRFPQMDPFEADELFDSLQKIAEALPWWVIKREYELRVQQQACDHQPVTQSGEPELFPERSPSGKRVRDDSLKNFVEV